MTWQEAIDRITAPSGSYPGWTVEAAEAKADGTTVNLAPPPTAHALKDRRPLVLTLDPLGRVAHIERVSA